MSHCKNKVDWCLNKAKKELEKEGKHRGLIEVTLNRNRVLDHVKNSPLKWRA